MRHFKHQGKLLKQVRAELELSQSQLGRDIGVHSQFVSNSERELCALPIPALRKLVKKYNPPAFKRKLAHAVTLDHHAEVKDYIQEIYGCDA